MSYGSVKLIDACLKIGSGATPKGGAAVYLRNGTSLIRSQNVYNLHFDYSGLAHITEEAASKLNGVAVQKNDVLLNITGDSVARTCLVPSDVLPARVNQHVAILRTEASILNAKFLCYYLASPYMQSYMLGLAVGKGASRNAMTKPMIEGFSIPCPPIKTQCRIADILSAYDDLIENNQKQIRLLEESAQRLYKEWFVDLHFPGYEKSPIMKGVPNGWKRKTVEECLSFYIGGGWGKDTPTGKNALRATVIRGTDIKDIKLGNLADIPLRYHTENDLNSRKLETGDIIFELSNGNIDNIGRTLLIDDRLLSTIGESVICASFCKLLRPIDWIHSIILYCNIQYLQTSGKLLPYKKHGSNGINNFDFDGFLQHTMLIPKDEELIKPIVEIMDKIGNAQNQFVKLLEARDRLLPKLMSGELEV